MSVGVEGLAELAWPGKGLQGGLLMQVAVLQRRKLSGWHLISDASLSRLSIRVGHGKNCPFSCNSTVDYLSILEGGAETNPLRHLALLHASFLPLGFHGGEMWPES
jgi:hypothetical protein